MLFQKVFNSQNPNHILTKRYLEAIFTEKTSEKGLHFNPWLILQNTELALSLAQKMVSSLSKKALPHGVCILANSGLPLGVLAAQAIGRPMYFYNRNPWKLDDINHDYFVFPKPPEGITLSLVDSHVTTGFTAKSCYDLLMQRGIRINSIMSPISFLDILPDDIEKHINLPYKTLTRASRIKDLLLSMKGIENVSDIVTAIKARAKEPRYLESPYVPTRFERLKAIVLSPFEKNKIKARYISEDLRQELSHAFGSSESDIWSFFLRPMLIKQTCINIGKHIDFDKFDTIVAVGVIGTIFSLCLAWHNQYRGKIVSTYEPNDWEQSLSSSQNVLMCTGRLLTGIYLHGTSDDLKKRGINPKMILALRLAPESVKFPRNLMLRHELNALDCDVVAVS